MDSPSREAMAGKMQICAARIPATSLTPSLHHPPALFPITLICGSADFSLRLCVRFSFALIRAPYSRPFAVAIREAL